MICARRAAIFLVLPLIALGCTTASPMQTWIEGQGGLAKIDQQSRVDAIARRLTAYCHGRTITVGVLATDQMCAFGWPSGHLFVSRGLVEGLSDQELAAAIAHEMGHLLSDGQLQMVASLRGCGDADREVRADAAGIALLQTAGIPPRAMISMLRKVQASIDIPQCRAALQRRIELISAEYPL